MPNDLSPPFEPQAIDVSQKIRKRLVDSGARFFANDNIAAYIAPGELDELVDEVSAKVQALLGSLVIDTAADHNTRDTCRRVARMFVHEVFGGRYVAMPNVTAFPNVSRSEEMIVVGPITVRSACSHHLCPVIGKLWIGVLPNRSSDLIGLSKYTRVANWIMNRPQIQEEAMVQLADVLDHIMAPDGLALVMEADHFCMQWRGVKDMDTQMTNSVMRGVFRDDASLRGEFFSMLKR